MMKNIFILTMLCGFSCFASESNIANPSIPKMIKLLQWSGNSEVSEQKLARKLELQKNISQISFLQYYESSEQIFALRLAAAQLAYQAKVIFKEDMSPKEVAIIQYHCYKNIPTENCRQSLKKTWAEMLNCLKANIQAVKNIDSLKEIKLMQQQRDEQMGHILRQSLSDSMLIINSINHIPKISAELNLLDSKEKINEMLKKESSKENVGKWDAMQIHQESQRIYLQALSEQLLHLTKGF